MSIETKTPWTRFNLTGKAFYMFNNKPRPADFEYNKPPMFCTELQLTDDSVLEIWGEKGTYKGPTEIIPALKAIRVTVADKKNKDGSVRTNIIKFQSKVTEDTTELSRKPKTVDAEGNEMPSTILIGNESFVEVRGSLPDYRKTPPKPGRKPLTPTFDTVQVIDLVEYIAPEGAPSRATGGFKVIKGGYTVGSTPSKTVHGEAPAEADEGDVFASLETPLPEPTKVTKTVVKRKA
jgi:hypothetical protein